MMLEDNNPHFDTPSQKQVIAYQIRDSLYLNVTNRCTNDCAFCVRKSTDFVKGYNLRLDHEPSAEEIMEAIGEDPTRYKEIAFCGYGEPTLRLDVIKKVAGALKEKGIRIRMVTNGQGNLIHNRSIAGELAGIIDKISISVNVDTAERYDEICRSNFGMGVFEKVKEFARDCRDAGIEVELTFLDLPGVDVHKCEEIARKELKMGLRLRRHNVVG